MSYNETFSSFRAERTFYNLCPLRETYHAVDMDSAVILHRETKTDGGGEGG